MRTFRVCGSSSYPLTPPPFHVIAQLKNVHSESSCLPSLTRNENLILHHGPTWIRRRSSGLLVNGCTSSAWQWFPLVGLRTESRQIKYYAGSGLQGTSSIVTVLFYSHCTLSLASSKHVAHDNFYLQCYYAAASTCS